MLFYVVGSSETIRGNCINIQYDIVQLSMKVLTIQTLNFSSSMGRKTFVIKSSIFSRYYSDSASDKPNIEAIGVCNSNPLD